MLKYWKSVRIANFQFYFYFFLFAQIFLPDGDKEGTKNESSELQIHTSLFQDFWPIAVGALLTTVAACLIIIIKVLLGCPLKRCGRTGALLKMCPIYAARHSYFNLKLFFNF